MFGETPTCPPEQHYNPLTGQCEIIIDGDTIHPCPQGQHTDPISYTCKPNTNGQPIQAAAMGPIGWSALAAAVLVGLSAIWKQARPARPAKRRRR
jgi:hypothetical protein